MKKFYTVAFAALCSMPMMAQISFSSTIDLALRNSPRVKMAEADVAKALAVVQQAKDVYIPSMTIGSGIGPPTYGFPLGNPTLYNVQFQSLVYDQSQRNYSRAAKLGFEAANLSLRDVKQQVAEDAALTYISISNDQERLEALGQQHQYAARLTELVQQRLDAGQDTRIELTKSRLTDAQVRLRRLQLADDLMQQRQHLALMTALPEADLVADRTSIPAMPTTYASAHGDKSPAVLAAEAVADSKLQMAFGDSRRMYRPLIGFGAQYGYFASYNNYDQYYQNYQPHNIAVGLQVSLPILDWGKRAKARESLSAADHARKEAAVLRDRYSEEQMKNANMVAELQARSEVVELERDLASDQLEVVRIQVTNGNPNGQPMTPKDEANAHIEERAKYLQYLESDLQLKQAQLDLLRTSGQLEDWIQTSVKTTVQPKP